LDHDADPSAVGLARVSERSNGEGFGDEPAGATPLDPDERDGLIPHHVQTRAELNQWEALNIARGEAWAFARRNVDPLSIEWLQELHRHLFGETWEWAGSFRRSDKNISPYRWTQVPVLMRDLVENVRAQYAASDQTPNAIDDIALRFHHELVRIHPWPNGNGRHARVATD
jgi:Fic-DOC domain mobile mystery protein B